MGAAWCSSSLMKQPPTPNSELSEYAFYYFSGRKNLLSWQHPFIKKKNNRLKINLLLQSAVCIRVASQTRCWWVVCE